VDTGQACGSRAGNNPGTGLMTPPACPPPPPRSWPASVARRLSAIRQLHRFLYAEGHRGDDPAAILEGPKRSRPLPKVLTIGDVDRLIAAARQAADATDVAALERLRARRLHCLLELLYATGLRISELVALPASAARRDERVLIVRGKGGKERLVPLNEAAKSAMRSYASLLGEVRELPPSKWLFPSFGEGGHLTRQHAARELKSLAGAAGLRPAWDRPSMRIVRAQQQVGYVVDRRHGVDPDVGIAQLADHLGDLALQRLTAAFERFAHAHLHGQCHIVGAGVGIDVAQQRLVRAHTGRSRVRRSSAC